MYNKFKLLILLGMFLFIVYNVNAVFTNEYCTAVNICPGISPGDYSLECNSVSNGFCPENYSKTSWINDCPLVNYGRCVPCDPDCTKCSTLAIYTQPSADPCGTVDNTAVVNNQAGGSDLNIHIFRGDGSQGYNPVLVVPPPICGDHTSCNIPFTDSLALYETDYEGKEIPECFGGDQYCYSVCSAPKPGIGVDCPYSCGRTLPSLDITLEPDNDPASGSVSVSTTAKSRVGVRILSLSLNKWSEKFQVYRPVNIKAPIGHPDHCSFRLTCGDADPTDCSNLVYVDNQDVIPVPDTVTMSKIWDTTQCENAVYELYGFVDDSYSQRNLSNLVNTDNINAPCTDECPIFTSKTLNTVLARVKTWITPAG